MIAASVMLSAWAVFNAGQPFSQLDARWTTGRHQFAVQLTGAAIPMASRWGATAQTERAHADARIELAWPLGTGGSNGGRDRDSAEQLAGNALGRPDRSATQLNLSVTIIGQLGEHAAWGDRLVVTGRLLPNEAGEPRGYLLMVDEVRSGERAGGLLAAGEALRESFRHASANVPGVAGELVTGLAIGDTSRVSSELSAAMKTSSLTHLMAVSGANCALIVGVVWAMLAGLGAARRWRIIAALAALGGFVLLVTPQPSVLRAAVMAVIALAGLAFGSVQRGLIALACAVLVLLWVDPWLSWNIGFALSVAATAGLLTLTRPLQRILERPLGPLSFGVAVPLAAQLACTPLLVLLSPSIALWGVPANIVAAWFAPAATMLGVVACVALPLLPWLGQLLVWAASVPAAVIGHVALAVAALPTTSLPWVPGVFGSVLAALAVAATLLMLLSEHRLVRRTLALLAGGAMLFAVGLFGVGAVLHSASRPSNWVIAACDVGQGDAFLIRDGSQIALIDTGPDPKLLEACLSTMRVSRLSLLLLTHYDQDHVGGVNAVLGRVDTAIVGPVGDASDSRLREALTRSGATVRQVDRGDQISLGNATGTILWPSAKAHVEPGNAASVTLQITLGGVSALFLGDLGEDSQEALRRLGIPHQLDVVKVAHHGSADQSPQLYAEIHARLALIGVGENSYGHPTAKTLAFLRAAGTHIARTDQQGLLLVAPAPNSQLTIWTDRPSG